MRRRSVLKWMMAAVVCPWSLVTRKPPIRPERLVCLQSCSPERDGCRGVFAPDCNGRGKHETT